MNKIKGSGERCKGNIKENFEMVPVSLFRYIELNLIKPTDLLVYQVLYRLDNTDYGYAFPTYETLMLMTRLSRGTISKCIKSLEKVGLIEKYTNRSNYNNNLYIVYKPLDQVELDKLVPESLHQYEVNREKLLRTSMNDKERFMQLGIKDSAFQQ